MRFILGVIVGALLTIGFAYVHDTRLEETASTERPFVNWDAVGTSAHTATIAMREEWDRLTAKR